MYLFLFKRLFDLILSVIGIIILSPLFFVISFILFCTYHTSPIYLQDRPGKNSKIFKLIKFKTMSDRRDSTGNLLPDVQRLTKVGRFMRSLSLDEFPQLINVIKGDMSLIGPRPLLVSYLLLYNPRQSRRHEVRPGMTGWAQINGRNSLLWSEKFELDVWYVDNLSFFLDIKILFITLGKVLTRESINSGIENTMHPFRGNLE